jgi:hypothetical protein
MSVQIGQTVRYHMPNPSQSNTQDAAYEPFVVAAIVTMTPKEWQPGYRIADGTWVPTTTALTQPKQSCVHLQVFYPPGVSGVAVVKDVPLGDKPGCYEIIRYDPS